MVDTIAIEQLNERETQIRRDLELVAEKGSALQLKIDTLQQELANCQKRFTTMNGHLAEVQYLKGTLIKTAENSEAAAK